MYDVLELKFRGLDSIPEVGRKLFIKTGYGLFQSSFSEFAENNLPNPNSRVEKNLSYVILNQRNIGDAGEGRFLLKRNFPGSVLTMIVSYLLRMLKIA